MLGIVMKPGWPKRYRHLEIPENMEFAVLQINSRTGNDKKKFLKAAASEAPAQPAKKDRRLEALEAVLNDALKLGEHDHMSAMLQVENALDMIEAMKS